MVEGPQHGSAPQGTSQSVAFSPVLGMATSESPASCRSGVVSAAARAMPPKRASQARAYGLRGHSTSGPDGRSRRRSVRCSLPPRSPRCPSGRPLPQSKRRSPRETQAPTCTLAVDLPGLICSTMQSRLRSPAVSPVTAAHHTPRRSGNGRTHGDLPEEAGDRLWTGYFLDRARSSDLRCRSGRHLGHAR
ncbi:hypothetical protein NDU88_003108 [Pleurodeles waltl]|uniref:Uncharacterized protein n=1 Tax=Pleurodeles waltl TaxID=8319 RepID=A0AAV7TN12_PLEWA|nr:hypothetical protein NDU88_003108 [Pleurodeles waltl]